MYSIAPPRLSSSFIFLVFEHRNAPYSTIKCNELTPRNEAKADCWWWCRLCGAVIVNTGAVCAAVVTRATAAVWHVDRARVGAIQCNIYHRVHSFNSRFDCWFVAFFPSSFVSSPLSVCSNPKMMPICAAIRLYAHVQVNFVSHTWATRIRFGWLLCALCALCVH